MQHHRLIRLPQLQELVPVSRVTIHRWVKDGKFPAAVKLCPGQQGAMAWRESDVAAWLESRAGNECEGGAA